MRLTAVLLILAGAVHSQDFKVHLESALEGAYLGNSMKHADSARALESQGQYRQALAEYTQVITDANSAIAANPGPTQDPTIYYVAGLAHTDSARMYTYLNVSNLFREYYVQHLADADRDFRTADAMYRQRNQVMWAIPAALATVHILQGDLAATQADMQNLQQRNPAYQPAQAAAQQVAAPSSAVTAALAALRTRIAAVTPEQWLLIGGFVKTVATALLPPQYQKALTAGITVTAAGYELYRQWQQPRAAQ